ncbi:MAG TPA: DUF433 domain-containing protein [Dehalococcoidia bacterium]|nr:DUF433 domain-containing protein [Dehalococcoidia bacterium]
MSKVEEIAPGITVDKGVRFGKPVLKGTRVDVALVLGQLAAGATYDEIIEQYGVTKDGILAALNYAAEALGKETIRAG